MTLSASYLALFIPVLALAVVVAEGRIHANVQPRIGGTFYGEIRELLRRRLDDVEVSETLKKRKNKKKIKNG